MDGVAGMLSLPAAPSPFRFHTLPSPYLLPPTDNSLRSSPISPLFLLSDDEDEAEKGAHSSTLNTASNSFSPSHAPPARSFRQLRVSDANPISGRSPLLAPPSHTVSSSLARFHPYCRNPQLQPPTHPPTYRQQLSVSQPSSPAANSPLSSNYYPTLPLPVPVPVPSSFSLAALSSVSQSAHPPAAATGGGYHSHRLPAVSSADNVPCVSCAYVASLLSDVSGSCARFGFSRIRIIDCRFQYEYDGGHIKGAEWLANHTDLDGLLAYSTQLSAAEHADAAASTAATVPSSAASSTASSRSPSPLVSPRGVCGSVSYPLLECVILHCEFSRHRAPAVYRSLRRRDRELNGVERFPALYLPELYVMQAGYAQFHIAHAQLCEPHGGAYVSMLDRRYATELKTAWKSRHHPSKQLTAPTSLTRATSASSALHHTAQPFTRDAHQQQQHATH